jgi:hypothetical protein
MTPNSDASLALPPGQPTRDLFNRQVTAQRAGIAQRKRAIHRCVRMGEDVRDEERLLHVAEKRLHRLLLRRWRTFAILAQEASYGLSKLV